MTEIILEKILNLLTVLFVMFCTCLVNFIMIVVQKLNLQGMVVWTINHQKMQFSLKSTLCILPSILMIMPKLDNSVLRTMIFASYKYWVKWGLYYPTVGKLYHLRFDTKLVRFYPNCQNIVDFQRFRSAPMTEIILEKISTLPNM